MAININKDSLIAYLKNISTTFLKDQSPEDYMSDGGELPTIDQHSNMLDVNGLHNLLTYESFDSETGIYHNFGTIGFALEISPVNGVSSGMADSLAQLYTDRTAIPKSTITVMIYGSDQIKPIIDRWEGNKFAHDNIVKVAKMRRKYLEDIATKQYMPQSKVELRNFRTIISVTVPTDSQKGASKEEKERLVNYKEMMEKKLYNNNIEHWILTPTLLINLVNEILVNKDHLRTGEDIREYDPETPIKDQILDLDNYMLVDRDAIVGNNRIFRSIYVRQNPKLAKLENMTNAIGNLFESSLQISGPFLLTAFSTVLDKNKVKRDAIAKYTSNAKHKNSQAAKIFPHYREVAEDWEFVKNEVEEDRTLTEFGLTYTCLLNKDDYPNGSKHIIEDIKTIVEHKTLKWTLAQSFVQLPMLIASLPMQYDMNYSKRYKQWGITRRVLNKNAVNLWPIIADWAGSGDPQLLYSSRRGQLMSLNFFNDRLVKNYNISIVAPSGSGKSFWVNEAIFSYIAQGGYGWIIDKGRSYYKACTIFGGRFVSFERGSNVCLNPFSTITLDDEDEMKEDLASISLLVCQAVNPHAPLSRLEAGFVQSATQKAFETEGTNAGFDTVYQILKNSEDQRQKDLATMLYPFSNGGVYGNYFNGKGNLDFAQNKFTVLELDELEAFPDLQKVVLFSLMQLINHAMYVASKGKQNIPKLCVIDEAWSLLDSNGAKEFISNGYRRARKYGGLFATATQGTDDYFMNQTTEACWTNSNWKIFLEQKQENVTNAIQKKHINASPYKEACLRTVKTNKDPGTINYSEFVLEFGDSQVIARLMVDPVSTVIYSTSPSDLSMYEKYVNRGYKPLPACQMCAYVKMGHTEEVADSMLDEEDRMLVA